MTPVNKAFVLASLTLLAQMAPNIVLAGNADSESPFRLKSVEPLPQLTKAFHSNERFSGADGACSVPLDERNTLWFFGDTFVRRVRDQSAVRTSAGRSAPVASSRLRDSGSSFAFINNSVAVQNIQTGAMKFAWRETKAGPDALIKPATPPKAYFWPGDGFVLDEKLFVVNKLVVPKPADKTDPNAFNFDWQSDVLVQITNGGSPPQQWKWRSSALPELPKSVLTGTACYLDRDYAYFYTSVQRDAIGTNVHPTGVARVAVRDLLNMDMTKFKFWTGLDWNPDIAKSKVIIEDGAPEMTISKISGEPYLVATYLAPLSSDICMRFSKTPEGPWSNPIKVYECPEPNIKVLGRKCSVYSAKAHPEFSKSKGEIVVSYCSNPGDLKYYLARPDLYYPHMIRVQLTKP